MCFARVCSSACVYVRLRVHVYLRVAVLCYTPKSANTHTHTRVRMPYSLHLQNVDMSKKCSDMDHEMAMHFGVSKAVLEFVIFCHQEESNWYVMPHGLHARGRRTY